MFPLLAAALLAAPPDRPAILIFGTGWGAEGTQASIEAHALSLAAAVPPDQLLIGGGPQLRSIQADGAYDELADLLGLVLDRRDGLHVEYRRPQRSDVGAATKAGLLQALDRLIAQARPVVVWGAGHGSGASDDQPASLELWGPDDQLDVTSLALHLDQAALKAHVAFVLGQCHSGAFADLMYAGGDPKRGLATPTRCVLAAVPADREAAGCTAERMATPVTSVTSSWRKGDRSAAAATSAAWRPSLGARHWRERRQRPRSRQGAHTWRS